MDILSKEKRSWNMSRIKSRDTKPELIVRSLLHRLGYRFRLHSSKLPGRPDIVLKKYGTVIFVHGCFWHRHEGCPKAYSPKSRVTFWQGKFEENVKRDRRKITELKNLGWKVMTIWECQTGDVDYLASLISREIRKR